MAEYNRPLLMPRRRRAGLGPGPFETDLVDDLGEGWSAASAEEQRRRLGIAAG